MLRIIITVASVFNVITVSERTEYKKIICLFNCMKVDVLILRFILYRPEAHMQQHGSLMLFFIFYFLFFIFLFLLFLFFYFYFIFCFLVAFIFFRFTKNIIKIQKFTVTKWKGSIWSREENSARWFFSVHDRSGKVRVLCEEHRARSVRCLLVGANGLYMINENTRKHINN